MKKQIKRLSSLPSNLILLFMLALLVRLLFFLVFLKDNPCLLLFDSKHYHEFALNIANGFGFVDSQGFAYFYRLPGYSLFLAACYKITNFSVIATLMIQLLLGSLVPLLIYRLARILLPFQKSVAVIASVIGCFYVGFIIFSGLVLSDILFLLFWILFLIVFFIALRFQRYFLFLAAGLLLGTVSLIRPVSIPLFLVAFLVMLIYEWKDFRSLFKRSVLFTLGWIVVVGWWLVRNFLLTGYVFFHTLSGPHFLNHSIAQMIMIKNNIPYEQAKDVAYKSLNALFADVEKSKQRPLLEIERVAVIEKLLLKTMLANPIIAMRHIGENIFKTGFALYSSELLFIDSHGKLPPYSNERTLKDRLCRFILPHVNNRYIVWVIWFEIIVFLLMLLGFCGFCVKSVLCCYQWQLLMSSFLFMAFFIAITFSCGYARLRLPIEPFLIIYATSFWINLFGIKGKDA